MHTRFTASSRHFRLLLGLALLAWTAFALEAAAHPLGMLNAAAAPAPMAMAHGSCADSSMHHAPGGNAAHATSPHAPDSGQGCCQHGACWCASSCSGVLGVAWFELKPQPPDAFVLATAPPQPVRSLAAPPLRPPII